MVSEKSLSNLRRKGGVSGNRGNRKEHRTWAALHGEKVSKKYLKDDNYIHFIYAHANVGFEAGSVEKLRRDILNEQKANFARRMRESGAPNSTHTPGGDEILDLFNAVATHDEIGGKLEEAVAEIYSQGSTSNQGLSGANSSGIDGYSYLAVGFRAADADRLAEACGDLVEQIGSIQEATQDTMDAIITELESFGNKNLSAALLDKVVKRSEKHMRQEHPELVKRSSDWTQYFVSEVLRPHNHQLIQLPTDLELNEAEKNAVITAARVAMLVKAIPKVAMSPGLDYEALSAAANKKRNGKAVSIASQNQIIAALLAKIGGNLSAFGGGVGEVADAKGLVEIGKDIAKADDAVIRNIIFSDVAVSGSNSIISYSVTGKQDSELEKMAKEKPLTGTYVKNDVTLIVEQNGVRGVMGLSVKKSKKIQWDSASHRFVGGSIKLHSEAPLYAILMKLVADGKITQKTIFNIAAGNVAAPTGLEGAWRNIIDLAVYNNFLNFISGKGESIFDNAYGLVINDHIQPIGEILADLAADNTRNYEAIKESGGRKRSAFSQYNQWHRTDQSDNKMSRSDFHLEQKALSRSNEVFDNIASQLQSTKINISLNFQALSGI